MSSRPLYQVLLLPSRKVAARHQSLHEASAWVRTYNEVMGHGNRRAVIAEESSPPYQSSEPPRTRRSAA